MAQTRSIVAAALLVMSASGTQLVHGQSYPDKPIRIVASGAASASDITARVVAEGILANLRQQAVVDNRGTGVLPGEIVSKAPRDGYTLLVGGTVLWLTPFLQDHAPFDPLRDFSPITLLVTTPNVLVVHPAMPVKTVGELVALAKSKPGEYNYGSTGLGSSLHLAGELFKSMSGVNLIRVPYKSAGQAFTDLFGGRLQLMFPVAPTAMQHARTGKVRALAVTSAEPSALAPGLPTIAASGFPGYESASILGLFSPAGVSAEITNLLNREMVAFISRPEIKQRLFSAGLETIGSSQMEFANKIKSEMARMGKVIKNAGIKAE